jgi:hypothetical protein
MKTAMVVLAGVLALAACGSTDGGSDAGNGTFKDELKFGTGIDYAAFQLTGEGTSFDTAVNKTIAFRLESSANFDGRFVRLYFNTLEQKDFAGCANADAHLCLSSFPVSTPGSYVVKAYLVKTNVDIGVETEVTSATLTLR